MRKNCSGLVFNKVLAPMAKMPTFGDPADFEKALGPVLTTFSNFFLKGTFVASDAKQPSIADLMAFHELFGLF